MEAKKTAKKASSKTAGAKKKAASVKKIAAVAKASAAVKTAGAKKTATRKTAVAGKKTDSGEGTVKKPSARKSAEAAGGSASGKNLIIVESPAKARTIEKYLGEDFKVLASVGHVIDLPVSKLGVDVENGFEPEYVVIKGKSAIMNELKRQARLAKAVFLAPDPDREGEAIAWHIANYIKDVNPSIQRATFNEITKTAVREAIAHPMAINQNLFNAQQARRVLDRLVGYKLSPLLWRKVRRGLSAGRVQSVAVRLICDREREILAFKPDEYWTIDGWAEGNQPPPFAIQLAKVDGQKADLPNQAAADAVLADVQGKPFVISDVIKKEVAKKPFAPFITSTLQQEASRKLRMTAKQTMMHAQRLYEGIELGALGSVGLITYMRTDSTRIANEAQAQIREYIGKQYGGAYVPETPRVWTTKKNAQDAHEAIRPTDIALTPEQVAPYLEPATLKVYTMIWQRALACQMVDAKLERTRVEIAVGRCLFVATGSVIKFDGYLRVYQEARDETGRSESDTEGAEPVQLEGDETLPPLETGQTLKINQIKGNQHFTQPPPRYTEAGLIKELEKQGIGRPSTYASIISTIQDKEYATKEGGTFRPSDLGNMVTELLTHSFPHIMDVKFTAMMEDQLDRVEDGTVNWVELLDNFYGPFAQRLEAAVREMRNVKAEVQTTDIVCDKCGSPMVVRWGRNGKFLACSAFPECRNTKPIEEDADGTVRVVKDEPFDKPCPACGSPMAVKNGRRGRFVACTAYPECKTTLPYPIGVKCPREGCDGELVERRSARGQTFFSCNKYPECKFSASDKPYRESCDTCGKQVHFIGTGVKKRVLCCNDKQCEFDTVTIKD